MTDALSLPDTKLVGMDGRPISTVDDNTPHWLTEEQEDKNFVFDVLGDLSDVDLFYGWVLVAKYIRRTVAKNILASDLTQKEDGWQGKVGLVVKKGPAAFVTDKRTDFYGASVDVGDWVVFRHSDGWDGELGTRTARFSPYLQCLLIQDAHIIGKIQYPGRLY